MRPKKLDEWDGGERLEELVRESARYAWGPLLPSVDDTESLRAQKKSELTSLVKVLA